jgi:gliding motility-associated-like protein
MSFRYLLIPAIFLLTFCNSLTGQNGAKFYGDSLDGFDENSHKVIAQAEGLYGKQFKSYMDGQKRYYIWEKYGMLDDVANQATSFNPGKSTGGQNVISALPCVNEGFENGSISSWTAHIGQNTNSQAYPNFTNQVSAGSQVTVVTTPYSDAFVGTIPNSPLGGSVVARINNSVTFSGAQAIRLSQRFPVTTTNYIFDFAYWAVMNDAPNHTCTMTPYMSVRVRNNGTLTACPNFSIIAPASSGGCAGIGPLSWVSMGSGANAVRTSTAWQRYSIDLSPYMGNNVTVEAIVAHCTAQGHFGYAYFDSNCGTLNLRLNNTSNVSMFSQNVSVQVGCGTTATLGAPTGFNPFTWQGPGGLSSSNQSIQASASGVYSLNMNPVGSCAPGINRFISMAFAPPATVVATPTAICVAGTNTTSTLTASGASSYTWSTGQTGSSIVVSPNVTTIYTVTAASGTCVGTFTVRVQVLAPPVINISASQTTVCSGPNGTITLTGSGAVSYTWSPGNIVGSPVTVTPPANTPPRTTTTYTVRGLNAAGCAGTRTINLTVDATPNVIAVKLSPATASSCIGDPVTLLGSGGTGSQYTWTPGGQVSNLVTVNPIVNTVYTVVSVNQFGTCSNSNTIALLVDPGPAKTVAANPTITCPGVTATLTANAPSAVGSLTWFPGGSTGNTFTVNPLVTTTYSVVGTNLAGCSSTHTIIKHVAPSPTVVIAPATPTLCFGSAITLTASGGLTYTWTPAPVVNTNTRLVNPTVNTVYSVAVSNGSCTSTRSVNVVVVPNPTVNVSATPTAICLGASSTLNASGANTYLWLPGNMTSSSPVVSPSSNTTYTVTGNTAGCTNTKTITLVVNPRPTIVVAKNPSAICPGNCATLTPSGAQTYTFLNGGPVVCPTITTTYSVSGTSSLGCVSAVPGTVSVIVNPQPNITFNPATPTVCAGSSVQVTASGAVNYTWQPGGMLTNVVNVAPAATTIYTVTGTNAFGCARVATVQVTVIPVPTVSATATPPSICRGSSSTLTASGATTYTWIPGNLTSNPAVVSPTSTTVYTVTGRTSGCSDTHTVLVTVNPLPTITVAGSPATVCIGVCATLTPSGASTYTFINGGPVVCPTVSTTYSVSGTNGFGCVSAQTGTVRIFVSPPPTIVASPSSTTICAGQSANIVLSGGVTYTTNPGNVTGSNISLSPLSSTIYTVTGRNASGCIGQTTINITVNPIPVLNVTASPASICRGDSSILTGSGATSYSWQPGGMTGNPISVSPLNTTTYTMTGTSGGCSATRTVVVTVNPLPTITVVSNPAAICAGACATLVPSGASTYTFLNGGPVVCPTITTVYSVIGRSAAGCLSANPGSVAVTVNPRPNIVATPSSTSICIGSSANIVLTGGVSYVTNPGNLTASNLNLSPGVTTSYTVTGTNSNGCTNQAFFVITVNPIPNVSVSASPASICAGASSTLTASGAGSYLWQPGGLTGNPVIVTPASTTVYSVTGTSSGCSVTRTVMVTVNPRPTIIVSATSTTLCAGSCATLTPSGASTYTFLNGGPVVCPSVTTTYSVSGTNAFGCTSSGPGGITIVVNPIPTLSASASPGSICSGSSSTLSASGANSYVWMPGNLGGAAVVVTPNTTTTYTVFGTSNGCTAQRTVNVIVIPTPTVNVTANPAVICAGANSTLTATGAASYAWSTGASGNPIVVSPLSTTIYTVVGTTSGCNGTRTVQVTVNPRPTITVVSNPTAVCPGGCATLTPSGAQTYTFLNGGPVVCPSVTTTYSVSGTSAQGCISSNPGVVTVIRSNPPTIFAIATPTMICAGQTTTLNAAGANTFVWFPGSMTGASVVVSPAATTNYTVFGTAGCTGSAVVTVVVNPNPVINASASPAVICRGSSSQLTASGGSSYLWQPGSVSGNPITVFPLNTTIFTVTGTSAAGCNGTRTVQVTVNPQPTVNLTANFTSICAGSCATLSPSGALSYTFLNGGPVVCPGSTTTYSVIGSNGFGCVNSPPAIVQITVNPIPLISVTPQSTVICSGDVLSATASGATSYTWLPGNLSGSSVTLAPTASTTYTIRGGSLGCIGTTTMTVAVNPKPNVNASASPASVCSGGSSTLTATGAVSYTWVPGPSTGNTYVVSPVSNTAYFVTGENSFGCTDTETVNVTVNPVPSVSITATSNSICSGSSATLSGSGASSYTWYPGTIVAGQVIVTPATTTTYSLVGSNGFGCRDTALFVLSVTPTPTITIAASSTSVCAGFTVALTASGANSYTWQPGGVVSPVLTDSPTATTTYTVMGENGGCFSTAFMTIFVSPLPNITAVANPSNICQGESTTLTASGGVTYTWLPSFQTGATLIDTPSSSTTYTVVGQDAAGCPNFAMVSVNVNAIPAIFVSPSSNAVCIGSSATLTASGANTYTWDPGNINGNPVVVTPVAPTTYTVFGYDGVCTGSTTISIGVNPLPVITAAATPTMVCEGSPVNLTASGASNYTWVPSGQFGSSIIDFPPVSTTYTVTGEDSNGCSNTATVDVVVNPSPTLIATSSASAICEGMQVTLSGSGALSYTWEPGTQVGQVVNDTPLTTTIYTLSGTDGLGCIGSTTVEVIVYPNPTVVVSPLNSSVCIGSGATLTATGANSFTWFPSLTTGPVLVEFPTVATIYTVTGDNGGICFHTATVQVFVNPLPANVTASVTGTITCATPSVELFGSSTDTNVIYNWAGPLGYISNNQNPIGITMWGTYTLNVTDTITGCVASTTVDVPTDGSIPFVTPSSTGSITCANPTVTLNAVHSTTNPAYNWTGPAAFSATTQIVNVTVAGDYTVVVMDLTSTCTGSAVVTVGTHTEVTVTASIAPATCSAGASNNDGTIMVGNFGNLDKFDLVSGATYTGGLTYTTAVFIPTNGVITANLANPLDTVQYTLRIFDSLGCQKDFVLDLLPVDCSLRTLGLAKSVSTPTSNGDGTYDVVYTIIVKNYDTAALSDVNLTENLAGVFPSPTTFTVTSLDSSAAGSILLNPAFDGVTQTSLTRANSSIAASVSSTLSFRVRIAVNGMFGPFNNTVNGTAVNNINVSVADVSTDGTEPDPDLDNDPKNNSVPTVITFTPDLFFGLTKQGSFLKLDNNSFDVTYTISVHNLGNDTLKNIVVMDSLFNNTIRQPATYTMKSAPGAGGGLIANANFNGNSNINLLDTGSVLAPFSVAQITFVINVVPDTVTVLSNTASGSAFNALTNTTLDDISNNGTDPDLDDNGVWNETGDNVPTVLVLPADPNALLGELFIPQGFSPDGDGINDLFVIKGMPLEGDNTITIFNRWGNRVYFHANYDNQWGGHPNIAGTMGKGKLPQGTYYYIFEMKGTPLKPITGFIEIQYKD